MIILFIIISITKVIYFYKKLVKKIIENRLAIIHNFIYIFSIFIIAKIASQILVKQKKQTKSFGF
jgi:hypothetical protein